MKSFEGKVAAITGAGSGINLIFNNAGASLAAPAETARIEDFEWIMGVNFWGVVHGTQAFLPYLRASGDGHVINTSSLFGIIAMPTQGAYNASKFAVRGYTEALRMELEMEGVSVSATCVHPGGVATNIATASWVDDSIRALTGQDADAHQQQANRLINATKPDDAARQIPARQILAGVQRNARRVLIGSDTRRVDRISRLMGSAYQIYMLRFHRKLQERRANVSHVARPAQAVSSTAKDIA